MRSTDSRTRMDRRELWIRILVTVGLVGGALAFLLTTPGQRWEWHSVWRDGNHAGYILSGLWITFYLSVGALVVALIVGTITGVMRMSRNPAVSQVATVYIELVRGTPLLVQLYLVWHGFMVSLKAYMLRAGASFEFADFFQSAPVAGILVLGFFAGAYVAEIVRAALESIDKGQTEAAIAQGMTRSQVFKLILFPQAFRRMIPPLTGQFVSLIKDSSLLSIIGVFELTKRSEIARVETHSTFEVLLPLAILYLALTLPLSRLARRLELRLAV